MMPRRIAIVAGVAGAAVLAGSAAFAAWNGAGHGSAYSKALTLSAPQTATATPVSTTAIDIKATAGPTSGPTPAAYKVMRGTTTVCASVALNTACHDTGLTPSTTYNYSVYSLMASWTSAGSTAAQATTLTPDTTPPTAPTIASPTGGTNYYTVASTTPLHTAWPGAFSGSPGTDTGSGVARVEIQLSYNAGSSGHPSIVYWNGTAFTSSQAWVSAGTTWSYTWSASAFPATNTDYTVTARTVDNAGNVSTTGNPSVTFTFKS